MNVNQMELFRYFLGFFFDKATNEDDDWLVERWLKSMGEDSMMAATKGEHVSKDLHDDSNGLHVHRTPGIGYTGSV